MKYGWSISKIWQVERQFKASSQLIVKRLAQGG